VPAESARQARHPHGRLDRRPRRLPVRPRRLQLAVSRPQKSWPELALRPPQAEPGARPV
jgi:hypothetical protein